jgi:hypothetical protein
MKSAGKNKKNKAVRDPAKEKLYKELVEQLAKKGFTVRREKLKQGYGWKVVSGACQALGQQLIFVDQRMTQDDQISFLQAKLGSTDGSPIEVAQESAA